MRRRLKNLEEGRGGQRVDALRDRDCGTDVSTLELFFDLVYVFAISQISLLLFNHLSWRGAIESGIVTFAVWWAWIYTAWVTNWFDPRKMPVRLMLIALMCTSLVMTAGIPEAFESRAGWFAGAYVTIQLGRNFFCLWLLGRNVQFANFTRISFWSMLAAPLWLAGAVVEGDARLAVWTVAVVVDGAGPAMNYRTPFLGISRAEDWTISGGHLAERCQLFVIIALGESVLLTGGSLAQSESISAATALAFLSAFLISVLMWWVYFARAGRASEIFEESENPGAMGRVYTYFHLPMIAGIVVLAVANRLVIESPSGDVSDGLLAALVGGSLLYLFGNAVFNSTITDSFPWRRLTAGLAILAMVPFAAVLPAVALSVWVLVPFIGLATVDTLTLPKRGELSDDFDVVD